MFAITMGRTNKHTWLWVRRTRRLLKKQTEMWDNTRLAVEPDLVMLALRDREHVMPRSNIARWYFRAYVTTKQNGMELKYPQQKIRITRTPSVSIEGEQPLAFADAYELFKSHALMLLTRDMGD